MSDKISIMEFSGSYCVRFPSGLMFQGLNPLYKNRGVRLIQEEFADFTEAMAKQLTTKDRQALADFMCERWQSWVNEEEGSNLALCIVDDEDEDHDAD